MNNSLVAILKKEFIEMFRDKKSLTMMLIIPFLIPLMVLGMSALFEMQMDMNIEEYNDIGFAYPINTQEQALAKEMQIDIIHDSLEVLKEKFNNGEIDLYVTRDGNTYTLHGDDSETASMASSLMKSYFQVYKELLQREYLKNTDVNADLLLNVVNVVEDLEGIENYFASYIVNYAFLFILMAITVSATYPSTDTTAGEKERGTLETLLTLPIKSRDVIIGKFLSVSFSSVLTGLLSLILAQVSFLISEKYFEMYQGTTLLLSFKSLFFALLVIVAYSFLISGMCIAIASKSKTFKEAQSALTPLTFISFFPGMVAFMIGVKSTLTYSFIPFLNYTLILFDISNGVINYLQIACMLISTLLVIWLILKLIVKQYKSEKVLF